MQIITEGNNYVVQFDLYSDQTNVANNVIGELTYDSDQLTLVSITTLPSIGVQSILNTDLYLFGTVLPNKHYTVACVFTVLEESQLIPITWSVSTSNPEINLSNNTKTINLVDYLDGLLASDIISVARTGSYTEALSKPITMPIGELIEYKGEMYKAAGNHIASLTGCSPNLALRFLRLMNLPNLVSFSGSAFASWNTPMAAHFFVHPDNASTIDFSLDYSSMYYTGMVFQNEGLLPLIPGVTVINQIINSNLLINLRDIGTGAALIFSGVMGQQGRSITRGAFIQFFTGLPAVNRTTTIQIGSNIVNGGPLIAGDILIATSKGYTVNII